MQGIYTYIPETNHVPRQYNVSAILSLLFMVSISLVPALALLYFYVSTFRSMCAVLNMAVFCNSFTSWFPGMLLIIIIIIIIIIININVSYHRPFFLLLLLNQRCSPPLRLQASHCSTFRIMCDVPSIAVFCIESIECFPGTASKCFLKLLLLSQWLQLLLV